MYILIFICIVLVVLVISARRPAIALAFVLCTFALEQWLQSRDTFFIVNRSLINITSGLVVLYALSVKLMKERNFPGAFPLEAWLVIVLYFYVAASVTWSPVPDISMNNLLQLLPYILLMVVAAPFLVTSVEDLYKSHLFFIMLGATISVLLLFFTEWGYRTIVLAADANRLGRVNANPLAIANMVGYVMLASVLLNIKNAPSIWRILRWGIVVICLAVSVKTGSRGQFLFMLATALMFLPVSRSISQIKRFIPLLLAIIFISGIGYWAMLEYSGADTRWTSARLSEDLGGRYAAAGRLIEQWYSSPQSLLFGLGSSASFDPAIFGFYTHIVFLEIIGELGLIGFFIFITILWLSFINFRRSLKFIGSDEVKRGVLATTGALLMFEFLLSFKQGSFLGSYIMFGLFVIMARLNRNIEKEKSVSNDSGITVNDSEITEPVKTTGVKLRTLR